MQWKNYLLGGDQGSIHYTVSHVFSDFVLSQVIVNHVALSKVVPSHVLSHVVLTTEWQWLTGDVRFLTAGLTFKLAEVVIEDARVPTDWLEEVVAGGTVAGVERPAGGVGGGGAGEGGAGLGGAGTEVLQLQLTGVSEADSSVELTLAVVGLVVVPAHWTVDWRTAGAAALHHPPSLAGAGGGLVAVQSCADTLRVAAPAVHNDQLRTLQATLLQQQQ